MSLDNMKEEIRKKKLSIDEAYDNQDVGKTAKWQNGQQNEKAPDKKADNKRFKTDYRSLNQPENQSEGKYTKKMTFWMTEEVYDAFNEIHAKRTIAKKKVDKGALICEAIQLLVEHEEE